MKLILKACDALPCATAEFSINGEPAEKRDFGSSNDHNPDNAEPYGCGDMQFDPIRPIQSVLDKYGITVDEYNQICDELVETCSPGQCGWCI